MMPFDLKRRWKRVAYEMDEDKQEDFLIDAYTVFRSKPWLHIAAHVVLLCLVIFSTKPGLYLFSNALFIGLVIYIGWYWVSYLMKMMRFIKKWGDKL